MPRARPGSRLGGWRRHGLEATYHSHLGTISQAPDQFDRVLGLTQIRLCSGTAHIQAGGGDPAEVIPRYRDRVVYVHLKDYAGGRFLRLSEGNVDLSTVVEALGDSQAAGWWTIELDSTERDPGAIAVRNKQALEGVLRHPITRIGSHSWTDELRRRTPAAQRER